MSHAFISCLLLTLIATPASALRAPLGGVATVELSRGTRVTASDPRQLDALGRARGGGGPLFAGVISRRGASALQVRYEFFRTGHVRPPVPGSLDPDLRLRDLLAESAGGAAWRPLRWRVPPQWSERAMQLRWAYDVRSAQTEAVRTLGFAALLTREGVLLFSHTALDARDFAAEDARFRELLAGVQMRPERGWLDLRQADARAPFDASALIVTRGAPPPEASGPVAVAGDRRDNRKWIERVDWRALVRSTPWATVAIVLVLLRGLWGFLRRRAVDAEEIRMPPEAGQTGMPKPIEPDQARRRPRR